ncbi:uncharacterized protein [Coffea arabica]|uniref:Uncharacterized protein n=1 Tax=Coffea arabica TaxID=13443 RepID=A0ABM4X2N5_COFAR
MVGYDDLVDQIYNLLGLDRKRYKISLIYRSCLPNGKFGAMPLVNDNGVAGLYYLQSDSRLATEIYVEVEEVFHLQEDDSQILGVVSANLDRGGSSSEHISLFQSGGLFESQMTQLDVGDVQPRHRGRRRGNGRRSNNDPSSTSGQPIEHTSSFQTRCTDIESSPMFDALPSTDIQFVDVDMNSEPEPNLSGSDEENHQHDTDRQDGYSNLPTTTYDDMGRNAPWITREGPQLRYEAGVDAALNYDPLDVGRVEKLKLWNEHTKDLELGQLFETKEHVKRAVKLWSIKENREFKVRESTPTTWYVRCRARNSVPPCNWQLRATLRSSHNMWMIVTLADAHTCIRVCFNNDHRGLSSDIIAEHIIPHIMNGPVYKIKEIQASVKQEFHCDVSYKKAWYARRRAIDILYGDWPTSISQLPTYIQELQRSNPGTVVVWDHHPSSTPSNIIFDYIFWAFAPTIQGFRHLKPVICVDGTFLKGPYREKLLVAVGFDANGSLFPLAYALVDEENNRSWPWFMRLLRIHVCGDMQNICIISDRHHGIINAMRTLEEWQEPLGVHRFCLIHIRSNFIQKFKNERLKNLMYGAGVANQTRKYENFMNVIFSLNTEAYAWLTGGSVRPEQWALCKDGGYRWGHNTSMPQAFMVFAEPVTSQ